MDTVGSPQAACPFKAERAHAAMTWAPQTGLLTAEAPASSAIPKQGQACEQVKGQHCNTAVPGASINGCSGEDRGSYASSCLATGPALASPLQAALGQSAGLLPPQHSTVSTAPGGRWGMQGGEFGAVPHQYWGVFGAADATVVLVSMMLSVVYRGSVKEQGA